MQFIFQTLRDDPAVASLLQGKIYPQIAPQDIQAPYVTYSMVSATPTRCREGITQERRTVQVSIFSGRYAELHSITQAVRDALDGTTAGGLQCEYRAGRELYEDGDLLHHMALDFQLITRQ